MRPLVVAIDGPAAAGKGTVARLLARELGFAYIDTGAMYRCVALTASRRGILWDDEPALATLARHLEIRFAAGTGDGPQRVFADDVDVSDAIRAPEMSQGASQVSALSGVRRALVAAQQRLGASGCVVMEGRDIGTVVFPEADVKVFLTASVGERARRRWIELGERGENADLDQVRRAIAERDERDSTRDDSPLRCAEDAVLVETDGVEPSQVVRRIVALCHTAEGGAA